MNTQPEALSLADALLKAPGSGHVTRYCDDAAAELRRLQAENERLNTAIQYEQHRAERIGTHGPGCELWGPAHYECLVRAHEAIKAQRDELMAVAERAASEPCIDDDECGCCIPCIARAAIASVKDAA